MKLERCLPLSTLAGRALMCGPVLALLAACATATPPAEAPTNASPPALLKAIQAEIRDAACTSDAQCRSLPVGAKACGGPEGWMAWSTSRSNTEKLTALAQQHAEARRAQASQSGMASTCSIVPDPGAQCTAGRCVLRDASSDPAR